MFYAMIGVLAILVFLYSEFLVNLGHVLLVLRSPENIPDYLHGLARVGAAILVRRSTI